MDENLHKDNLEEFFKNSLNDENIDSSDDPWDVPSDDVWLGINETINPVPTPAPPFSFNLNWLLAAAASILILGLVYYNYTLQNKIGELSEVVENQKNTIDKLEKLVLENGNNNLLKKEEENEVGNNGEFSTIIFEKESSQTAIESKPQNFSNQNSPQKNTSNQSAFEKGKSIDNSQLNNSTIKNSNNEKTVAENNLEAEKASVVIVKNDANLKNTPSEGSISNQLIQKNTDPILAESSKNTFALLVPLSSKMIFAESTSQTEELNLEMLPVSKAVFQSSFSSTARTGFYVGAHIAPTYGYRNIKSIDGPVLRRLLNQQEKANYSVSLGMKAGYQFSKNWSVETGLNYYKNTIQSVHRRQVRFESQLERLNSDGSYDSNYQLKLATSYGEIETDVALTRSSDTQIGQNDYINLVMKTQQELKNLGIPIAIRYRTAKNKFHFSAKAGISTNIILQKDVTIKAAAVARNGIQHRRTIVDKQFSGLKNTTFDLLLGLGVDYDLSKNMSVYFEPTVTRSINPVYQISGKIKTYPIIAAFNVGLAYHF